nr:MAG TPA: antitoxin [Caudoviricetes sp.]
MDMKSNRPKVYVKQDSVRGLQRSLGLSDGAMAEKIGVSRQTYLRGLSGNR